MSEPLPSSEPVPRTASIMNRIVASSLAQPFLILLLTLMLTGAGARSLARLPVDAYPDLSPPIVEIVTQWPGHAAEEVERLISVPVEIGMNGIPKTATIRSISLYGLSDVTITFHGGTDNYFARQEVFNRMSGLSLPSGVTPMVPPPKPESSATPGTDLYCGATVQSSMVLSSIGERSGLCST